MLWAGRYAFELHQQTDAIQMGTHNLCLYNEVDKKYTGCNVKTMELLDSALIGWWVVIRLNMVLAVFFSVTCLIFTSNPDEIAGL